MGKNSSKIQIQLLQNTYNKEVGKEYKIRKLHLGKKDYPSDLALLPDPPEQLFVMGKSLNQLLRAPAVAIVGSRRVSAYGKAVTTKLAGELAERGVVIISGLAIGVDSLAHRAALEANGTTVAVLPSSLDAIYPRTHYRLAQEILERGGALVTEYPDNTKPHKYHFVARNRIVSGLADCVLITEAAERSGTLHTANFALDQGREVMAVPGNITSPLSVGTNQLIKTGATPVTSANDVLRSLGIETNQPKTVVAASAEEAAILDLLKDGAMETEALMNQSGLDPTIFNQTLTMLEITGKITSVGSGQWVLA